jgi:hypothetical protein
MNILPCPFCGVTPEVLPCLRHGFFVECENKDCIINPETRDYETEELAAAAWNTRLEQVAEAVVV